ncbi:hypothetical protein V8E51_015990 [Hyaloscypha variabilis]
MASEQLQDTADIVADLPCTEVERELDESPEDQYEEPEFCAIPLHILSATEKYFLETVPEPGKILSITLVSSEAPVIIDPTELQPLLESIAIPEHVLLPLQEYFENRRTNPEDYPKYVGVIFTQEDARLYENALSGCPVGCTHGLSVIAVSEQGAGEVLCDSQLEASDNDGEDLACCECGVSLSDASVWK